MVQLEDDKNKPNDRLMTTITVVLAKDPNEVPAVPVIKVQEPSNPEKNAQSKQVSKSTPKQSALSGKGKSNIDRLFDNVLSIIQRK